MNIAFIGTGIMGSAMAANLMAAGHTLTVHNRTQSRAESLVEKGASWADTPAAAVADAEVVITMLSKPDAVEATALDQSTGFLPHMQPGAIWMDSSTVNPDFSRRMAAAATEHNVRFLDAPVAGSKVPAQTGQLVFIVGGPADAVETCRPLFDIMGSKVIHVGDHGMGNALKLVVNHMLATSMLAFAEGLVLGEALGVNREQIMNTLIGGPVTAPFIAGKRAKIEGDDYSPEFPLRWMQKDLAMAAEMAFQTQTAMPMSNAAKELYQLAARAGYAEDDFSAIYAFLHNRD